MSRQKRELLPELRQRDRETEREAGREQVQTDAPEMDNHGYIVQLYHRTYIYIHV